MPHANTLIKTSSGPGVGIGLSSMQKAPPFSFITATLYMPFSIILGPTPYATNMFAFYVVVV
jgi:hypothetical protein